MTQIFSDRSPKCEWELIFTTFYLASHHLTSQRYNFGSGTKAQRAEYMWYACQ